MFSTFNQESFHSICDTLAAKDADLKRIIDNYGYPPMWSRPNTFESLVHIILEQQVSLASALAALNKLKEAVQEITPARVLQLSDAEFKACYFSRQKMAYTRCLAEAIFSGQINLEASENTTDDEVRQVLISIKGIGNWTVDVYLMFVLQRADIFPSGDLAAVLAFKKLKQLPKETTKDMLISLAEHWRPYRTVATMLLWHFYLSSRGKTISLPL
ncbi:DNA-3-methyladenine glycosylase family protein [Mucilaginibacter ginkgonis]|uniref:DNA-3-methyladenine glycosylase II n=1 Tax=Mucilaginibacter ginkgonis TaxID=2682091 RepID=A0A6I4IN87_9SPHI|nr:DNA-3-methyladenine glycosylase 2 family protein [Mucilaginibacter ginkgonis]QQL49457.1 DNA-3-methyladenine glycosylase 2 family protein [Mucilaginibacter ginkgonis]